MVTPFLEFTSVDHRKPFSGLVESYDEVVEHDRRFTVSAAFQSSDEATSVMENVYVELELVAFETGFNPIGKARGRFVPALLSLCNQRGKKDSPIAIDQYHHPFFTSLDCLNQPVSAGCHILHQLTARKLLKRSSKASG